MKKNLKIELLKSDKGQYYWHIKSSNGKIIAYSGETYKRKASAKKSLESMLKKLHGFDYSVVELW